MGGKRGGGRGGGRGKPFLVNVAYQYIALLSFWPQGSYRIFGRGVRGGGGGGGGELVRKTNIILGGSGGMPSQKMFTK